MSVTISLPLPEPIAAERDAAQQRLEKQLLPRKARVFHSGVNEATTYQSTQSKSKLKPVVVDPTVTDPARRAAIARGKEMYGQKSWLLCWKVQENGATVYLTRDADSDVPAGWYGEVIR